MWAQGYGGVIRYENEVRYPEEGPASGFYHKVLALRRRDQGSKN